MYKIKEIAQICQISISKIRYWDSIGVLRPNLKRDENNNRIFSDEDVIWINDIICFQETGMNLEQIKEIVAMVKNNEFIQLSEYFKIQEHRIISEIKVLQNTLNRVQYKINYYQNKGA